MIHRHDKYFTKCAVLDKYYEVPKPEHDLKLLLSELENRLDFTEECLRKHDNASAMAEENVQFLHGISLGVTCRE